MLSFHDRFACGALGFALEVAVLDSDLESELVLLELPTDAAIDGQTAPARHDPAALATHVKRLRCAEVGLDDLSRPAGTYPRNRAVQPPPERRATASPAEDFSSRACAGSTASASATRRWTRARYRSGIFGSYVRACIDPL